MTVRKMPKGRHALPFAKRYAISATTGCWNWLGYEAWDGTLGMVIDGRRIAPARYSYELKHGPMPKYLMAYRACLNRRCVNPDHVEPMTRPEMRVRTGALGRNGHPDNRGEMSPNARLTADDVLFIRAQPRWPGVRSLLARLFGMSERYIAILRCEHAYTWAHLKGRRPNLAMPISRLRELVEQRTGAAA